MPDEKDLVRAAAEGVAKGVTDSALEPFKDLTGSFCSNLGEGFGALGLTFRIKMGIVAMKWARRMLKDAGIEPNDIPPKLFLPLLEGASLEDDADLQERWAALIANAANPYSEARVLPIFAQILKQLSSKDALFLDELSGVVPDHTRKPGPDGSLHCLGVFQDLRLAYQRRFGVADSVQNTGDVDRDCAVAVNTLMGLGLLERIWHPSVGAFATGAFGKISRDDDYYISVLGSEFLRACRAPHKVTPQSNPRS